MRTIVCVAATVLIAALAATTAAGATAPPPIDPQSWTMPDDMTWAEYKPVPGTEWGNPALTPSIKKWKVALVVVDFLDQQFIISQPTGAHIFGNPQPGVPQVAREDVPEFYRDFLNTPSMLNHFVTMNGYWMEDSLGRYGVQMDAFGPYQMAGNMYEYFLNDAGGAASSGTIVAKVTARAADPGPTGLTGINIILAGGDRSPSCNTSTQPDCPGTGYNNCTLEVVQRIGNDSFTPGHGVLISKTKNADSAPFVWIMDPEDFNRLDFRRPNGEPSMISSATTASSRMRPSTPA